MGDFFYRLLNSAYEELPAFHRALKEYVASVDTNYAKTQEEMFVGFEGSFGSKHVSPRSLNARNLGNLVCVEGIVTKCKYEITTLVFYISGAHIVQYCWC